MGSIEFLKVFTTIEDPFVVYDPIKMQVKPKINDASPGYILYHSVEHLPAELPKEASTLFGDNLLPFLKDLITSDGSVPFEEWKDVAPEIKNACILYQGELTPNYQYIQKLRVCNQTLIPLYQEEKAIVLFEEYDSRIINLYGHLFNKMLINKALDVLARSKLKYRAIKWDIGLSEEQKSSVSLQVSYLAEVYEKAVSIIKQICEALDGDFSEN